MHWVVLAALHSRLSYCALHKDSLLVLSKVADQGQKPEHCASAWPGLHAGYHAYCTALTNAWLPGVYHVVCILSRHTKTQSSHTVMFPDTKVMVRVLAYEDVGKYP